MILNCWIIDDEPLALDLLQSYVDKTVFLHLSARFSNAAEAMMQLSTGEKADLIFLDIQMPDINGMELARFIGEDTRIVFTTAFSEYALESYKVSALDYLLKPFSYSDFLTAAQKALNWFELKKTNTNNETSEKPFAGIFVRSEYKLLQVFFEDILYIEGLKDYVKIYTETENKPILTLMGMKAIESKLPAKDFLRVHRSFIVNISKIRKINKNRISIHSKEIPIGETYRQTFFELINKRH